MQQDLELWAHCICSQAAGFAAVGTLRPQSGSRSCSCGHTASAVSQAAGLIDVDTLHPQSGRQQD